jgi:hypothetical protein
MPQIEIFARAARKQAQSKFCGSARYVWTSVLYSLHVDRGVPGTLG